jgi:hypothetical protein
MIRTLALVPFILLFGAGCGGLSTSQSVSPLDFLLPGLTETKPVNKPMLTVPEKNRESHQPEFKSVEVLAEAS